MITLLSPAKSLDEGPLPFALPHSQPALLSEAEKLFVTTRRLSRKKIASLMSISPKLAELNHGRFAALSTPFTPENAKQAALMFAGEVYRGLGAASLSAEDLEWGQDHLVMLSGLYGVLRPLDLIQPYRLEMGSALPTRRGKTLYKFWGERITKTLAASLEGAENPVVLNCASNEYFKSVQPKKLGVRLVNCAFKEWRKGELRIISFTAKRARGLMARYVLQNRLDTGAGGKGCGPEGCPLEFERVHA